MLLLSEGHSLIISTKKLKVTAFKGTYLMRSKIVFDNHIVIDMLEQVSHFNYVRCDLI